MGRPRFWPSENMRVAAFYALKSRGLKQTPELNKAMRYHYQVMADKGEFKSPTSAELLRLGVDTSRWNEGKGWLPPDMWERLRTLDEPPKGECTTKKYGPPGAEEVEEGEHGLAVQAPKLKGGTSKQEEQIRGIIKAGSHFKKEKTEEEKPAPTGRRWKGEHWDPSSKTWVVKDGEWWNPRAQKWMKGTPRTEPFYWIYEFLWDPTKYEDPCPLGDFHERVLIKMDENNRLIIEIPRDHLKTTVFNIGYMVYFILERSELAKMGILNVAWDPGLAETTFMDVTENLSQNEKILSFYGYTIDENRPKTQDKIYFTYQPVGAKFGLRCTSFKSGSITGTHPYLIILDDPQDEPFTDKLMQKFRTVVKKKLLPAVAKRGKIIITGTIKGFNSANDGYLWLEKNPTWTVIRLPAASGMPPMKDVVAEKRTRPKLNKDNGLPLIAGDGEAVVETYFHVEVKDRNKYKLLYPERYTIEDLVRKLLEMMDEGKSVDDFFAEYFLQPQNPRGKFFLKDRIRPMPPPGFTSVQTFVEWCHAQHYKIQLWIDPGGAKAHGITIVVGAKVLGKFYFIEILVLRSGLPEVAKAVARLIVQYGIKVAACEGNYSQKQTYADVIDAFLKQYMDSCGWIDHYIPITAKNNTGDKLQRIQTHISNMVGLEGSDFQFFINTEAKDYDLFDVQVKSFGPNAPQTRAHDFDILDGMASMAIHLFSGAQKAICISR